MIYDRIKLLCRQNGNNINKLEKELGFAKGSLCKIDSHNPSAEKLKKIAYHFGVSTEYLLSSENYEMDKETNTWEFNINNNDMQILVKAMSDSDSASRLIAYAKKLIELKNMEDM